MEQKIHEPTMEMGSKTNIKSGWLKHWKFITSSIVIVIGLVIGGFSYYQATHFNAHIIINGSKVGGLTAAGALEKLTATVLTNEVFIGEKQILDGNDTKMGFSEKDLPAIKNLLKSQWTFFPSLKEKEFSLKPSEPDQYRYVTMKKQVGEVLLNMNKNLKAPVDALVSLENGQVVVSNSISGEQYDVDSLLKDYEKQDYKSEIQLNPVYIQPIKEDSLIIENEKNALEQFLQTAIDYKVQDKVYPLKASELIKGATVSRDLKITITAADIQKKIEEINNAQATLNKDFTFTTHSGNVITVKGRGYGWALDVEKETPLVQQAFESGEKAVSAANIYGNGWSKEGIGYETSSNNGIGDTYAEVSIAEQRIWIYRNGQLVVTTNVVTGNHNTGEDTSKGVWYILYKKSPSILRGSRVDGGAYEVEVKYWAPFTNGGQGFHDASWRSNWGSNAYIGAGSGGCINTPPSIMKKVYDNLSTYEPVIIY